MDEYTFLFKNRKFIYLLFSQVLSQLTINIMNFILLIKLFEITGSTIATSLLWVSYALPAIIIGPIASASVDMIDKRKMLIVTNFLQSLVILIYATSHRSSLFLLYGIVIIYSFLNQFYIPAEVSSLVTIVKKKFLPQANSLFLITQQTAMFIGFGIAGILNTALGFDRSLYLCSGFLFLAFISVYFLPAMRTREKIPLHFEKAFIKFFKHIYEGYRFISSNQFILASYLLLLSFQVLLAIVIVNLPAIAQEIYRINIKYAGVYMVVPASLGAGIGAVYIPKFLRNGFRKFTLIEFSLKVLVLVLFVLSFVLPEIPEPFKLMAGLIINYFLGLSFIGVVIPAQTFLQEITPSGYRGRVLGNFAFLVTIITIIPILISGTLTELFGPRLLLGFIAVSFFSILYTLQKKKKAYEVVV
jgi:MFS family permease